MKKQKKYGIGLHLIMLLLFLFACPVLAQEKTILPSDASVPSGDNIFLGFEGSYYSDAQKALDRINEIRLEACKEGNVPNPDNPSVMLKESDYVPMQWSTSLEQVARLRAAESAITGAHARLNGKSCFSVNYDGTSYNAECLAWYYGNSMISGINMWYSEKEDWVQRTSGAVTGHYTSMIKPSHRYVGLGLFYRGYSSLAGNYTSYGSNLASDYLPEQPDIIQTLEVSRGNLSTTYLAGPDAIYIDANASYSAKATVKSIQLDILGTVTYQSSDENVATVDANGLVTGIGKGEVTITATVQGLTIEKTIQVSCDHDKELKNTVDSTCTKTGVNTYICKKCQETVEEEIPLKDHDYQYSNLTEDSMMTGDCKDCHHQITFTPPTTFSVWWSNTATTDGFYYGNPLETNPKGSDVICWISSVNGDSAYQEMIIESSDADLVEAPARGMVKTFSYMTVKKTGMVKFTIYPKYNPALKKTYLVRVGDPGELSVEEMDIELSTTEFTYSGTEKTPSLKSIQYHGMNLSSYYDYTYTWENNINAGTASMVITGKGLFSGEKRINYTIKPANIQNSYLTLSQSSYEYDETAKEPTVSVRYSSKYLVADQDYTINYVDNTKIGSAKVVVTGKGNYQGEITKNFSILHTIHKEVIDASVEPSCLKDGLTEGKHCAYCDKILKAQTKINALGHDQNIDPGKAATCLEDGKTDHITCKRCQAVLQESKVIPALGHDVIEDKALAETCTKTGLTAGSHCGRCQEVLLAQTSVPALGHEEAVIAGKEADCENKGLTEGSICTRCKATLITQKEIPALGHDVQIIKAAKEPTCTEDGNMECAYCVRCDQLLSEGEVLPATGHDIKTVSAQATLTTSGYTAKKCSICKTVLSKTTYYYPKTIELSKTSFTYTGKAQKPSIKILGSNGTAIAASNYKLTLPAGTNVGSYTVKVVFTGNYKGSKTLTYKILPKTTSLVSLTPASKTFTAKWTKLTTQTTGYQLQYSTSANFANPKYVTITKNTTLSSKVTKLLAKKKYFVRIRTYKTVNSVKYYSAWSAVKTVITK